MAQISVWYVRAALLHFALGATVGAWALAATGGLVPPVPLPARPLHVEGMLVGWMCQLTVGVALWIFPFSGAVSADRRVWVAWGLLNGGIGLAVGGQWMEVPLLTMVGRGSEMGAALLLLWALWPRLQPLPTRGH